MDPFTGGIIIGAIGGAISAIREAVSGSSEKETPTTPSTTYEYEVHDDIQDGGD